MADSTITETVAATTSTATVAKVKRSRAEIIAASIAKVSTGDAAMDTVARRVLTAVADKSVTMAKTKAGFAGKMGTADITVGKVAKGKSSRYELSIGNVELGGPFAAKAYFYAAGQHKVAGVTARTFDAKEVASLAAMLD
jgi:hypothetical protein